MTLSRDNAYTVKKRKTAYRKGEGSHEKQAQTNKSVLFFLLLRLGFMVHRHKC
jgi:hypothetical protein